MNKNIKSKKSLGMYLKNISKVKLDKNDVIVVHMDVTISGHEIGEFTKYLQKPFPYNKILIINKGATLSIVSKENNEISLREEI